MPQTGQVPGWSNSRVSQFKPHGGHMYVIANRLRVKAIDDNDPSL